MTRADQNRQEQGTRSIGGARVAFMTAPIAVPAGDPWDRAPDVSRAARDLAPDAPKVHRRFDPELSRRDALARLDDEIRRRQSLLARRAVPGRSVRLRHVLELDALREAQLVIRDFDCAGLTLVARAQVAQILQEISLLDPLAVDFREALFHKRQRLYVLAAGGQADERLLGTAAMAVRVLEDAIRRACAASADRTSGSVLDEHAVLVEEQRIHALVSLQRAIGRMRLAPLDREAADALVAVIRRVDPQAFGFDPRNQRFVRHVSDLIDRVGTLGMAS